MDKYDKQGLTMLALLVLFSGGIATSIVSIAFDVSHMLQVGHATINEFLDIFMQVTYVVLNGYMILLVHEGFNEKRECS